MVCTKCSMRMRIPVEQFSAVPVEVLSPTVDSPSSLPPEVLTNCAGSAPSSPKVGSKVLKGGGDLCPALAPLSPPPVTSVYSALPRRAARRSNIYGICHSALFGGCLHQHPTSNINMQ